MAERRERGLKELRARWASYMNNTPYESEGNIVHDGSEPWWPDLDDAKSDVQTLLRQLDGPSTPIDPHNESICDDLRALFSARVAAMSDAEITRQLTVLDSVRRDHDDCDAANFAGIVWDWLDQEWERRHPSPLRKPTCNECGAPATKMDDASDLPKIIYACDEYARMFGASKKVET